MLVGGLFVVCLTWFVVKVCVGVVLCWVALAAGWLLVCWLFEGCYLCLRLCWCLWVLV